MKDLKQKWPSFFDFWPLGVIFLVSLLFFYPVLLQSKVPLPADALVGAHVPWTEIKWPEFPAGVPIKNQEITDSISQFYPWRGLAGDFWRKGVAPLWNPYMFSGTPFLATWHSAALHPFNFLYLLLSDVNAWTALVFLQIFLSGVFMYLFLRELQLSKLASLLGSFAFSFSGYMIAWLEFATGGQAGLWLPLLLLLTLRLARSRKFIWIVPIAAVFYFVFTAGDFQVPLYITTTYVLFGAYLSFKSKVFWKNFVKVLSGFVLGVLLSSAQLIPTIELYLQSVRVDDPYITEYFFGLMHWEKIVNFIWPDFFGNVVTRNYWGKFGYHEYLSYAGVVTLLFVVVSFFRKKIRYETFFWVLLLASLIFLFPTPLAFLPYKLKIPGLGTSSASRIIFLVDFCIATLAAYGFTKWQKKRGSLLKTVFYFLIITAGVGLGVFVSLNIMSSQNLSQVPEIATNLRVAGRNMIPSTLVLIAAGLTLMGTLILEKLKLRKLNGLSGLVPYLIAFLALAELLRFGWKNTPFSPRKFVFPKTEIIEFLQAQEEPFRITGGIPLNLFMPFNLRSAEGYDPIYPKKNSQWYSLVNAGNLGALSGRYGLIHRFDSPLLDQANVKYVIDYKKNIYGGISDTGSYAPGIMSSKYEEVFKEGRISVFENKKTWPYVFVSTNYEVVEGEKEMIGKLLEENTSESRLILLEKEPGLVLGDSVDHNIKGFEHSNNKISFNVESSGGGLLFLSESFYPGWNAYIDGVKTEIFPANYIYQALPVTEGEHLVEFIYDPKSFRIGKWLSASAALFLAATIIYEYNFKKSS